MTYENTSDIWNARMSPPDPWAYRTPKNSPIGMARTAWRHSMVTKARAAEWGRRGRLGLGGVAATTPAYSLARPIHEDDRDVAEAT